MKKFVVLLVVVAMTLISAMAYAASDVTVSGTIDVRSRDFSTLNLNKDSSAGNTRDTQERVRLNVNAKVGDVKGKVTIENDWDTFGRFENPQGNGATAPGWSPNPANGRLDVREAWINFNLPGIPVNVTTGHQLLALGQGWFFRSMKYGSDAWVVANQTGNNTVAFVNVKVSEGLASSQADDIDAYVLLDVLKLNDKNAVGIDLTDFKDRRGLLTRNNYFGSGSTLTNPAFASVDLQNIGLNYNGQLGPINLKAEADFQMGKAKSNPAGPIGEEVKFKGNQIIVQGALPVDPVTINFTIARGSGNKDGDPTKGKQIVNALDADPHYTFLYEYKIGQPAQNYLTGSANGSAHLGFANTTALNVGASFAATKSLTVGADFWYLQATEKVLTGGGATSSDIGQEVDVKLNWAVAENLSWNWVAGLFKPGDAMKAATGGTTTDNATGIQGVLSFKF